MVSANISLKNCELGKHNRNNGKDNFRNSVCPICFLQRGPSFQGTILFLNNNTNSVKINFVFFYVNTINIFIAKIN